MAAPGVSQNVVWATGAMSMSERSRTSGQQSRSPTGTSTQPDGRTCTAGGPRPTGPVGLEPVSPDGTPCHFPFLYHNADGVQWFDSCTTVDNGDGGAASWCATAFSPCWVTAETWCDEDEHKWGWCSCTAPQSAAPSTSVNKEQTRAPPSVADNGDAPSLAAARLLRRISKHAPARRGHLALALRGDGPGDGGDGGTAAAGSTHRDYQFDEVIPATETYQVCRAFTLDTAFRSVVAIGPLVEQRAHVHHMVAHWCRQNEYFDSFVLPPGSTAGAPPCVGPSTNFDRGKTQCTGAIFAYTPGTQEVRFPAGTGLPVGTGQGELQHIILNVHYNNPTLVRGLRDRSGFRFVYSRDTVTETVSMLKLGDPAALDYLPLPARRPRAEATLECPAGCTSTFPHAVRVFAVTPHMHLRGRALQMFIRRQNAADEELVFNVEFYDHEFQSYVPVDFLIEPGDTVITRCTYDTSDADRDVTMGQATSQELCLGAVLYQLVLPQDQRHGSLRSGRPPVPLRHLADHRNRGVHVLRLEPKNVAAAGAARPANTPRRVGLPKDVWGGRS